MIAVLAVSVEVDNNGLAVGLVVVGLLTLLQLAATAKSLFVRQPSIDQEFATKAELAAHVALNTEEHRDIFSKLNGTERGWRNQLAQLSSNVAAIDERSKQTQAAVTLLNQNVVDFLAESRKSAK